MLYKDNKLYQLYEAYNNGVMDDELLGETARKLNLAVYPTPTYEIDPELAGELRRLMDFYVAGETSFGDAKPYSQETFVRNSAAFQIAQNVVADKSASNEDYQYAIDKLSYAMNNICISEKFAKQTYVLSLEEQNDNGFYDEARWNDFATKRDALRDSFKTNNEKAISDAYFALYDSFTDMTSGYLSGDVNNDGIVNIDDATLVQKYVAGLTEFTGVQVELAACYCAPDQYSDSAARSDYGFVPEITIDNATALQKALTDGEKIIAKDLQYGEVTTDFYGIQTNTKICLNSMGWDSRFDYVTAKVEELETEGII